MKIAVIIAIVLLLSAVGYLQSQNMNMQQQLQLTSSFQTQLQLQTEQNTLQRLDLEREITGLQDQLQTLNYQLSNLDVALQTARTQINPQYEDLLQQARLEIAQESPRPPRPSGSSAFETISDPEMARSRAEDNIPKTYGSFVNSLGIAGTERLDIMSALIDFGSERYQLMDSLMEGALSAEETADYFGSDGLINAMTSILTDQQLDDLRQYDMLIKRDTLREVYGGSLSSTGGAISGASQDMVMDVVIDELLSQQNNYDALVGEDGSMITAHNNQIAAYERSRQRLQDELSADQLAHFDRFVANESKGVDILLEATTDGSGRVSIMRARVGVNDLPQ
ncbi:MAG: hypothetical protein COA96_11135 [SAR86 cluster bacterium]|uniref:Uncharacterized protein n=1 Tax=SAR86 cluster bacterium TaxID=2030880 RepID=A0A2A5AX42_9GAMM|nr:MAG: hypothetical protein COA96_11135 [SAR86 cluster bacterium]